MAVTLRYLGWSAFEMTLEDGRRLLLDPLLDGVAEEGVPPSPAKLEEFDGVDAVLVTHIATDHVGAVLHRAASRRGRPCGEVARRKDRAPDPPPFR
jgi:L-ascorbate metabolism protein UlaG (beta-lactamase superfamily)